MQVSSSNSLILAMASSPGAVPAKPQLGAGTLVPRRHPLGWGRFAARPLVVGRKNEARISVQGRPGPFARTSVFQKDACGSLELRPLIKTSSSFQTSHAGRRSIRVANESAALGVVPKDRPHAGERHPRLGSVHIPTCDLGPRAAALFYRPWLCDCYHAACHAA
jgi:hypothetical protein